MTGLQIWNAAGQLTLDLVDQITRTLGTVTVGATSGSITDSALALGTPWWILPSTKMQSGGYLYTSGGASAEVTVSGTTLSWVNAPVGTLIIYGIF